LQLRLSLLLLFELLRLSLLRFVLQLRLSLLLLVVPCHGLVTRAAHGIVFGLRRRQLQRARPASPARRCRRRFIRRRRVRRFRF
jgi:hypothetical protein